MIEATIQIEWYSGHTLYDQPRRLSWGGQTQEVLAVLSRGSSPQGAFLEILTTDRRCYRLEFDAHAGVWHCWPSG